MTPDVDVERNAIPRLQPGSHAGGGVQPAAPLPPKWQAVVDAVMRSLNSDGDES